MDAPTILSGRIMVADGPEFACTAQFTELKADDPQPNDRHANDPQANDLQTLTVFTQAPGQLLAEAVCYLDGIGAVPGRITARNPDGLTLHPTLNEERRKRITARLAWKTTRAGWTTEQREALRLVPEHREVQVRFADDAIAPGEMLHGEILDLSRTGAKIQLFRATPAAIVGAAVTAGKRFATVVRVEDTVIAIRFRLPFSDETFNASLVL
ncbi:pilus assembly protein PilZ [Methylobacterium sp. 37f]|uniref:pilus assembly protein PilZ n=1 Tax=Methylobacterium sp. 37f TaxID=2817058 RepID=UPI001FFD1C83|nr:pilus assembly protein PilZ [Methylobacterium sp. 37f]MCK2054245.1 pilus assembly protein PilZ [Methylobacterium sp. 37f]